MSRTKQDKSGRPRSAGSASRQELLDLEKGTYLKKWTGKLPVALLYPNTYHVGMSSLGFQLVYRLLNEYEDVVCERLFLPEQAARPLSVESGRAADNFPILFCSISFEQDYVNLVKLLIGAGLQPLAKDRPSHIGAGSPLVVCGGVATFMNPEPLAPFVDLFLVGEAEKLLPVFIAELLRDEFADRKTLLRKLNAASSGFYGPMFYEPVYAEDKRLVEITVQEGMPPRIEKVYLESVDSASHSELLTPATEFADLYLTELGRGCSRGCRFCAAGFVYRPHRLWDEAAVVQGFAERPDQTDRVGLLGMEMTEEDTLERLATILRSTGCSLSFSSLRADRISDNVLHLLGESGLKSVAIAPDGASERLRRVINKNLSEQDLVEAAGRLAEAGLYKLKLYLMIGLPTETVKDLQEFLELVEKIHAVMKPVGQRRGRLCEVVVSVNSFVPKPWTPFQYHPFGLSGGLEEGDSVSGSAAVQGLRAKISVLKKGLKEMPNTRANFDNPDQALFQAVLSRGDRRLGAVLLNMAGSGIPWKQAMKQHGLTAELFATRQYGPASCFPWNIIDHSIHESYLWGEYCKAFEAKTTVPCDTRLCRRCGVCDD